MQHPWNPRTYRARLQVWVHAEAILSKRPDVRARGSCGVAIGLHPQGAGPDVNSQDRDVTDNFISRVDSGSFADKARPSSRQGTQSHCRDGYL